MLLNDVKWATEGNFKWSISDAKQVGIITAPPFEKQGFFGGVTFFKIRRIPSSG